MDIKVLMKELENESKSFSTYIKTINEEVKKRNWSVASDFSKVDQNITKDVSKNIRLISTMLHADIGMLYDVISQKYSRLDCEIASLSNYYTVMQTSQNEPILAPSSKYDAQTLLFASLNIDMPFFLNLDQTKSHNRELEEIIRKHNLQ